MHRRAFTLFELLAVIGIIVLLMAMLFPAFAMVKKQAMKTKTRSLMMNVSAACANFKNTNGYYPESFVPNGGTDIYLATFGTPPATKLASAIQPSDWQTFGTNFWQQIATVDRDSFSTKVFMDAGKGATVANSNPPIPVACIVDAWGSPLRYRPSRYYPFIGGSPNQIDTDNPPMQDSFQLWSIGSDEKDGFGQADSDDITAWQK